ncbi:MAG: NYN domain-containing protein [Sphingobacteriales bacterium]|nr:MAG: NYN domain-containing protein [Sphingobacteriales bacterium]
MQSTSRTTRIGVFYDGNYLMHVSRYYNYVHDRKARISISGLHNFIRQRVSDSDGVAYELCPIVDAHYFRGRLGAYETAQREKQLLYERVFDDILTNEGVTTHYLPIRIFGTSRSESNTEVWLSLEAYELTLHKRFDVVVLIASDGDYAPLVRKLNTLGTRVMLVHWEFSYVDDLGRERVSQTSRDLVAESAYPIAMHTLIDEAIEGEDGTIDALFVPKKEDRTYVPGRRYEADAEITYSATNAPTYNNEAYAAAGGVYNASTPVSDSAIRKSGTVKALKDGYGFISSYPRDAFFYHTALTNTDFAQLQVGDNVEYSEETLNDGRVVAKDITVV